MIGSCPPECGVSDPCADRAPTPTVLKIQAVPREHPSSLDQSHKGMQRNQLARLTGEAKSPKGLVGAVAGMLEQLRIVF
jgi:hypothetical protein